MRGFVLDCHPDPVRNEMVLWVKDPHTGEVRDLHEPFAPTFYVASRTGEAALDALARDLAQVPQLRLARVERRLGLEARPRPVLEVAVRSLPTFRNLAHTVDRLGDFRRFDLFDVDLRLSHQFLLSKHLFPFAWVEVHGDRVTLDDEQWALEYEPPTLATARLSADLQVGPGRVGTHQDALARITLEHGDEHVLLEDDEPAMLAELGRLLDRLDPDVLLTPDGDRFLVRTLHHRAARHGVPLRLGRGPDPRAPLRGERSYFTYGKIAFQPRVEVLHGRLHIDEEASFFMREAGFWGLVDLSRITSTPIQELARVGAGTAVTAIQIDRAKREGRLVPWKKNRVEDPKTEYDLVKADRGGFIFDPKVGLFDGVVELDFASMYPNIMVTRNVSPETLLCACCEPDDPRLIQVPQIDYHTCRRPGFIGRALAPLIARRETFKRYRKERPEERERYQAACDAIKWLAVCSFGYQGYKNARFGRIECHEAICAWGREILLTAAEIAREEGFEVIHGIVDSLWLTRTEPWADPAVLSRRASEELGIPLEVEGEYDWIVMLPTRSGTASTTRLDDVGALNRFYGCFSRPPDAPSRSQAGQDVDYIDRGRLKVRGVELRQHSCPGIVRRAQEAALLELAQATDAASFHQRLPRALDAVRPVLGELRAGETPAEDLVIPMSVSQPLEQYRVMNHTHAALVQLREAGVEVSPGDTVRFVVLDAKSREPRERLVEARLMHGDEGYDRAHYETLLVRGLESLFLPLGWDAQRLADVYAERRTASLFAFG